MRTIRDTKTGRFGGRAKMATGAALAAALFGTSAFAQGVPQQPREPSARMQAGEGPGHKGPGRHGAMRFAQDFERGHHGWRHGRHHGPRHGMMSPAKLAGALAALETGIGIQPDQMGTWRNFTGALVAFAEAAQPPRGRHGMGPGPRGPRGMDAGRGGPGATPAPQPPEAGAGNADDAAAAGAPGDRPQQGLFAFRMLDRFADRAIDAGEKAKTLKSALADLEATLTPEQVDRARGLVRAMMRDMRKEHRGGRWDRHDRGDRTGWRGHHRQGQRGPMSQQGGMHMGPGGPGGPADEDQDEMEPETPSMDEPQQG
ncbi:hypothetical protein [Jiella avicenniae]|uniref:LTXXQ motif family protein n=1 Tax=Jiella avicenniae TaxID=2907202 RepID=A0A9X1NYW9_9HYPH|nr:hypothetical protein [Jiella avicenniae]MCE7027245.1 hypothetical protein [Jiella avicenniae]